MEDIIVQHLLTSPSYFRQVFPFLKKEHFEKIEHRTIFSYIQDYYFEYKEIPSKREIVTIIKSQKDSDLKDLIVKTFSSILKATSDIKEQFLKDKTEEHIKAKELMDFLISSAEDIQKGEVDIPKALQSITDISKVSLQDDLGLDFNDIEERIKYYKTKLKGISTGLPSLDKVLGGGFRPKTLNVVGAPSGIGKCSRSSERIIVHGNDEVIDRLLKFKKEKNKTAKVPIQVKNENIQYVNEKYMSFAKLINEFINTIKYVNNDSLTDKEKDNAIRKLISCEERFLKTT